MQTISRLFVAELVSNCRHGLSRKMKNRCLPALSLRGAIAVFDKSWKGPAFSYIGRDELEAGGEAFLAQIRREAKRLVGKMVA